MDLRTEFNQPGDISHLTGHTNRRAGPGHRRQEAPRHRHFPSRRIGWLDGRRRQEDSYLVAPVYSFSGDDTKLSYSQTFIDRVKAYMYWQLFYLPPGGNRRIRESFVRLDRIQAVHRELLEHMPRQTERRRDWVAPRLDTGVHGREPSGG